MSITSSPRYRPRTSAEQDVPHEDPVVQLALTVRTVARRQGFWTRLRVRRAERSHLRLHQLREHVMHRLADQDLRSRRAEINAWDDQRFRYGVIGSWLPGLAAAVIGVAFVVNDATFVYSTARVHLDVPASVPFFHLSQRDNLLALAMAVVFTTALFVAVAYGGRTLAHWWDPNRARAIALDASGPTGQLNTFIPRTVYGVTSVLMVLAASVALHLMAEARFEGRLFSSGTDLVPRVLSAVITALPLVLLLVVAVVENPRFVHIRRLTKGRTADELWHRTTLSAERQAIARYESHWQSARSACARLQDVLDEAAMRTWPQLAAAETSRETERPSGVPASGPSELPIAGYSTDVTIRRFEDLPAPAPGSKLLPAWREYLSAPISPSTHVYSRRPGAQFDEE